MPSLASWIDGARGAPRTAVVGVGNPLRGDDGAGSRVAAALRGRGAAPVFDAETVPENYLGELLRCGARRVLFVDAARLGGSPGERRLAPLGALAPRGSSSHAPSLALLGSLLESHGLECWLLGIEPGSTEPGAGLSPPVDRAVREVVGELAASLAGGAP